MTWDQPHWSGRPQSSAGPKQKLRPNAFARLARLSAGHAVAVVLIGVVLAALCTAFAVSHLSIDPDQRPRISLGPATTELQAELDAKFPGVEQTFLAAVSSSDAETSRQQATALASTLAARKDLFLSAFVPGTGTFYSANAMLYRDLEEVRVRVDALLQIEPLFHALAAAPDIQGFTALVTEIGKAVEQGRSPPGLEAMLTAAAASIEAQAKGKARPVHWAALAGLDGEVMAGRWYVLATPVPGMEREAAGQAREASSGMQDVAWLWPRRALAASPSNLRDFVVPASLSALLTLVMLSGFLGSLRQALSVMLGGAVTLSVTAAVAAALNRPLDGATWSFAIAVLAPVIVGGGAMAIAFEQGRARGLAPLQAVMMAAQRQGGFVSAAGPLFAAVWMAWLVRQLPSLNHFAVIAIAGCAAASIVSLTLLPAALVLSTAPQAEEGPHWLDGALAAAPPKIRGWLDVAAMVILAVAVFSAIFLPAMRFGERLLPSSPPPSLETPDSRGAVNILAAAGDVPDLVKRLSTLPEVGAIRTAEQFLPPDAALKIAELQRLQSLTAFEPAFDAAPPDDATASQNFEALQEQLDAIATSSASSPELRDAASRLKRAVELYVSAAPVTGGRAAELEQSLFGTLGAVSTGAQFLASLREPTVDDLDPQLLRRFVAEDGTWRIEVMPRSGTGELSFAAALRRAVPQAAGEPVVSLVRNEMIHHETMLALAAALVSAAVLVIAALRSIQALVLVIAPAAAFLTLTAAVTVMLGISLNAAMLAGVSAATAVLMASAMLVAARLSGAGAPVSASGLPPRAVLLAPFTLAAAAAPLVISSRPSIAELGASLAMLMLIAAVLGVVVVPALARWIEALTSPRRPANPANPAK